MVSVMPSDRGGLDQSYAVYARSAAVSELLAACADVGVGSERGSELYVRVVNLNKSVTKVQA